MKYTERDIEKATRLKSEGFNWIATNKNGRPFAYSRMPYRCADDSNEYNIWENQPGTPWLMLSKEDFKSITWENEPVYIDEIIAAGKVQANGDTAIERLTAENAALQKRLENAVELPCKVGYTIYCIRGMSNPIIKDWKVQEIIITDHNFVVICGHPETKDIKVEVSDHYKEWWFIDRVAAEARLEELKGDKNDR